MIKKFINDFKSTKQPEDDFLKWLLLRKFSTRGKVILAVILWALWMRYAFDLVFMVNFFKFIIFIGFLYIVFYIIKLIKYVIYRYTN
jgi:hypothetical protein